MLVSLDSRLWTMRITRVLGQFMHAAMPRCSGLKHGNITSFLCAIVTQYHLPLCNIHTMSPPSSVQYSHNITSFLCAIFTQYHLLPLCDIHTMSPSFVQYAHNVTSFLCAIVTPCHLPLSFLCAICTQCHLLPLCNSHTISPPSSVQYAHNVTSFLCAIVTQYHLLPLCNIHILVLVDSFNTHTLFGINCCNYPPNLMEIFVTIFKVVAKKLWLTFCGHGVSLPLSILMAISRWTWVSQYQNVSIMDFIHRIHKKVSQTFSDYNIKSY